MDRIFPKRKEEPVTPQEDGLLACMRIIVVRFLETFFYHYGRLIGNWPYIFIFLCLLLTGLCAIGINNFSRDDDQSKLWVSVDSDFLKIMDWQKTMFPPHTHVQTIIFKSENVLRKEVLLEMLQVRDAVVNINTSKVTWEDVCSQMPTLLKQKTNSNWENKMHRVDASVVITDTRKGSCEGPNQINTVCQETSILELWGNSATTIQTLSQEQILSDVNYENTSLVTGFERNFTHHLSQVERNKEGQIVSAKAARHTWSTKSQSLGGNHKISSQNVDSEVDIKANSHEWEKVFVKTVLNESEYISELSVFLTTSSSFTDIMGDSAADVKYFIIGCFVVLLYVTVMLGKFNLVEQRPVLSLLGLSCVGLSLAVSVGLCSAFYISYGPVNDILPFLLLGLGVDDMFVIMQGWNSLTAEEKEKELPERIGCALRHAGVAITVTSLTNFSAFLIGSTTALPALRSFCLYAAVGIISIYFFQSTYFVAWLTVDQHRLEQNRQGLLWCWKIGSWAPSCCSQKNLLEIFFAEAYTKFLLQPVVKVLVMFGTIIFFLVSIWGFSQLQLKFDPIWLLPQDSYLVKFRENHELYFPSFGESGSVFFGNFSYFQQLSKIELLTERMKNSVYISSVNSWYDGFKEYSLQLNNNVFDQNQTETEFLTQLGKFLYSPYGLKFRTNNFRLKEDLTCDENSISILASTIDYIHQSIPSNTELQNRAMKEIKSIVEEVSFKGFVQPFASSYLKWETNYMIGQELYRNMGLAVLMVLLVMLILVASVTSSLLVVMCVLLTLVDVGALMHWTGLTIDTISCVDLVLAIGLCVDYAAHIGYSFMTTAGTRDTRVMKALVTIGPAVLNGGFTTFLSFVFLSLSDSYIFVVFFKIFLGVCLVGLYHGLVFLPVLLSLVGPAPHLTVTHDTNTPTPPPMPMPTKITTITNGKVGDSTISIMVQYGGQQKETGAHGQSAVAPR